ncbi:hypothetical protein E4U35_000849 [Claviceps purpurea]|nr:hypothetical protein E4U35_000849 [Claviceps purpurea]
MVQITSLMVAVIMAMTPVTQAATGACTPGLLYCGGALLRNGYDVTKIIKAAKVAKMHEIYYYKSLYTCNADGGITHKEACITSCIVEGSGESDRCDNVF